MRLALPQVFIQRVAGAAGEQADQLNEAPQKCSQDKERN
jgi:hypothetical protein